MVEHPGDLIYVQKYARLWPNLNTVGDMDLAVCARETNEALGVIVAVVERDVQTWYYVIMGHQSGWVNYEWTYRLPDLFTAR